MKMLVVFYFLTVLNVDAFSVQKYINPCGALYTLVTPSFNNVEKLYRNMKPHLQDLTRILKFSHHKNMDAFKFEKTWIPDESFLSITTNGLNSAQVFAEELPKIYKSLQYFSYALDILQEDMKSVDGRENCYFFIESLPDVIEKHQQLTCAVDVAIAQLSLHVPYTYKIVIPEDWINSQDKSCTTKLFRFAEIHIKYKNFISALHGLSLM